MFWRKKECRGITVKSGSNCVEAKKSLYRPGQALGVQGGGGDFMTVSTRR
jgi:hypothetical protein